MTVSPTYDGHHSKLRWLGFWDANGIPTGHARPVFGLGWQGAKSSEKETKATSQARGCSFVGLYHSSLWLDFFRVRRESKQERKDGKAIVTF